MKNENKKWKIKNENWSEQHFYGGNCFFFNKRKKVTIKKPGDTFFSGLVGLSA